MTPAELSRTVLHAVRRAVEAGELSVAVPVRAVVERPGSGGSGDYATSIALQLAKPAGRSSRDVAEVLQAHITEARGIAGVEISGPGFLNIRVRDGGSTLVEEILSEGARYGYSDALAGRVIPLRIPYDLRAEVVADALVRMVATQGGRVEIDHAEPVNLRPVPAPEDPAPLGPDAARWALLHPAAHDRPRITADHLVRRAHNPLFRVQYAHARTRALTRNAAALGFTSAPGAEDGHGYGTAPDAVAAPLFSALAHYPPTLTTAARRNAPDRLARHLVVVADAFFRYHDTVRVLPFGEEKPLAAHRARLALAEAVGTVLAGGLLLLGIDAPEYL